MTETKLFVSSCSRREMARRRHRSRFVAAYFKVGPTLLSCTFLALGTAAFFAGRGAF